MGDRLGILSAVGFLLSQNIFFGGEFETFDLTLNSPITPPPPLFLGIIQKVLPALTFHKTLLGKFIY